METIKQYIFSMKTFNLRLAYNLLFDAISIFVFLFVILGFYTIANLIIGTVQRNDTGITGFLILALGLLFAFVSSFGVFLFGFSFFKSKVYNIKFKTHDFRDLLNFHVKWFSLWAILYILLSLIINPIYQGYYLIIGFLFYSVFTHSIRYRISNVHLKYNIKQLIKSNMNKYILVFLTFIILSLIGLGLLKLLNLSPYGLFWLILTYLFTLSWGRSYLSVDSNK